MLETLLVRPVAPQMLRLVAPGGMPRGATAAACAGRAVPQLVRLLQPSQPSLHLRIICRRRLPATSSHSSSKQAALFSKQTVASSPWQQGGLEQQQQMEQLQAEAWQG